MGTTSERISINRRTISWHRRQGRLRRVVNMAKIKTRPIKVLHVVHWPVSGITSLLRGLIPLIAADGVQNHIIFFYHDADTIADFSRLCESALCIHLERSYPCGVVRYRRFIKSIAPDILHTHSFQPLVWGGLLACGHSRHVTTVHSNYPYFTRQALKDQAKKTIEKFFLTRGGVRTVAVGKVVHALLAGLGVPERNLFLIENGVDITGYGRDAGARADVRRELGIADDQFVFVTLGRLDVATKGYDILLQSFAPIYRRHGRRVLLVFIGDGPDRQKLAKLAEQLGISGQVRFIGYRKEPARYLGAGDAYVCSSVIEGFGLATAEAMLCGLPVIATRVGANPEMITDGVSGILVEPGDPAAISTAMDDFLSRRYPLDEMARLGTQQVADKYDIKKTAAAYASLYRSVMETRA